MGSSRRYKSKKKRASPAGLILCFVAILAVGILLGTRVFVVKRVAVRGNSAIPSATIIETSGLTAGQSIFSVEEEKVRSGFERVGEYGLKQVVVTWPDTVELIVEERTPVAVVDYLGTSAKVDVNGVVIERLRSLPDGEMPVVTGLEVSQILVGQKVMCTQSGQVEAMSTVLGALYRAGVASNVSELNVADLDNLYLMTRGGMMVVLGDDRLMDDKVKWMTGMLDELAKEGKTNGKVDLSSGKFAIYGAY